MKRTIKAVRETIWQMDSPSDLVNVLTSIQQQLQLQNIAYEAIGVNVIDPATELLVSKYVLFKGDDLAEWRLWQRESIASDLKGNGAILETCWRSGKSIYRTDLNKEDRYDERTWIEERQLGLVSLIDVPFSHGTLALGSSVADAFSENEIALLEELAEVLSDGCRRLDDLRTLARQHQEVESLLQAIEVVARADDLDSTLQTVVEQTLNVIGVQGVVIFLYDEQESVLVPRAQSGFNWGVYQHIRLQPGEDISGAVFVSGQSALYRQDTAEEIHMQKDNKALFSPEGSVLTFPRIGIVVPLKNRGRTIGTLSINRNSGAITPHEVRILERLGEQAALAIERSVHRKQLDLDLAQAKRREAIQQVRLAGRNMENDEDIGLVVQELSTQLVKLEIPFEQLSVQTVNQTDDAPFLEAVIFAGERDISIQKRDEPWHQGEQLIIQFWQKQQVVYRSDLTVVDAYGEYARIAANSPAVRSVVDIPFSHGTLALNSDQAEAYSAEHLHILQEMVDPLSESFHRMDDLEKLGRREIEVDVLAEAINAMARTHDLDEMLQAVLENITRATESSRGVVFLYAAEEEALVPRAQVGHDWQTFQHYRLQPGESVSGKAFATEERVVWGSKGTDGINLRQATRDLFIKSLGSDSFPQGMSVSLPLWVDKQVIGVLSLGGIQRRLTARDLTLLDPLAEQVSLAIERDQRATESVRTERLRSVGELSAGISHNLNNILTGVLVPAQMLKRTVDDPQVLEWATMIISAGERASDLVQELYRSVKMTDDTPLSATSISSVVEQAVETSRPRWKDEAEAQGVRIEIVVDLAELPEVTATPDGLHSICTNLIFNAVDAMPQGGTLTIQAQLKETGVALIFRDTGVGMSKMTQQRIFEPFFTTKANIGTGLGMATVYNTLAHWGGTIDVESTPGHGATFFITLPKWQKTHAPLPSEERQYAHRKGQVLLIDDDESVAQSISLLLQDSHDITIRHSGKEVLAHIAPGEYDAIVIDLGMPDMTGDQLAQHLRRLDPWVGLIMITGWILNEDDPRRAHFDQVLYKPIPDPDKLKAVVTKAISLHDERMKIHQR
ncbi:MAG: signal transduction histidine kinase [Candidatus Latescibacterota bacterium]|jgi:signal transduction histidine kinase